MQNDTKHVSKVLHWHTLEEAEKSKGLLGLKLPTLVKDSKPAGCPRRQRQSMFSHWNTLRRRKRDTPPINTLAVIRWSAPGADCVTPDVVQFWRSTLVSTV